MSQTRLAEVDGYIAAAPDFARPILERLRSDWHAACPRVRETIKWSAPFFEVEQPLGNIAAFKKHVVVGFWRGADLEDPLGRFEGGGRASVRTIRITSMEDLPTKTELRDYMRRAAALAREAGPAARGKKKAAGKKKVAKKKAARRPPPKVPEDLVAALQTSPKARATFEAFSPSHRREYVDWLTEAKREATRRTRLEKTIALLEEGKSRHWKYRSRE